MQRTGKTFHWSQKEEMKNNIYVLPKTKDLQGVGTILFTNILISLIIHIPSISIAKADPKNYKKNGKNLNKAEQEKKYIIA